MPTGTFNPLDPETWATSTLYTAVGPIRYWVLADLDEYYEQYAVDASLTKVQIAVAWEDVIDFKWYALGFAEPAGSGSGIDYLWRNTPLKHPTQENQYLIDLKKRKVIPGLEGLLPRKVPPEGPGGVPPGGPEKFTIGRMSPAAADATIDNWFNLDSWPGSMPARVVFDATFGMLPYEVVDQDTFNDTLDATELVRFVTRTFKDNPREFKHPTYQFETDEATPVVVPEVGFRPFSDETHNITWHGVPWELVPWTAIKACKLRVNDAAFDYNFDGSWGKFNAGCLKFEGTSREIAPYHNAAGQRVTDLPYVFTHQPADGGDDGHQKLPRGYENEWKKIRVRGSSASPKYPYATADFLTLFAPEPA